MGYNCNGARLSVYNCNRPCLQMYVVDCPQALVMTSPGQQHGLGKVKFSAVSIDKNRSLSFRLLDNWENYEHFRSRTKF